MCNQPKRPKNYPFGCLNIVPRPCSVGHHELTINIAVDCYVYIYIMSWEELILVATSVIDDLQEGNHIQFCMWRVMGYIFSTIFILLISIVSDI
jgi:hypothetical protein